MLVDLIPSPIAQAAPEKSFTLTGWHVLSGFIAFFVTVVSVNGFMMYSAISTMPGLDAGRNGYEVSQRYNGEIEAAAAQQARGWTGELELVRSEAGANALIRFTDSTGAPIDGLQVELKLLHPTSRQLDHVVMLTPGASGVYAARIDGVTVGIWDASLTATRGGERLYQSRNRKRL
ncbi:MAG: FixH family protein [Bosea sp.]|jgi:nitrogen fixation protein FixH|nr:FixH family protein [Bosea sp. (in: a-proteobacteria)]